MRWKAEDLQNPCPCTHLADSVLKSWILLTPFFFCYAGGGENLNLGDFFYVCDP